MSDLTVIGLMGYAQVGKDTVAKILVEEHGFTRLAFADKLRSVLYDTNPVLLINGGSITLQAFVDSVGWDEAKQWSEVRRLLQDLGVAVRDHLGYDTWRDALLDQTQSGGKFVITDVRFPTSGRSHGRSSAR